MHCDAIKKCNSTQQHGLSIGYSTEDTAADAGMSVISIHLIGTMISMLSLEPLSRDTDMHALKPQ